MGKVVLERIEKIASGIYLEGLALDHARGLIWYSDVIGGGVHGVRPDGTDIASFNKDRMWTGGVLVNGDGSVLSSGEGGIMWNNPDFGRSGWLLRELHGQPINGINEMVPDGEGGIFFGTSDLEMVTGGKAARPTAIYRLSLEQEVIKLADGIGFTNGLMFDRERHRFYCNDTFNCTWVFDVTEQLTLENKRQLLAKEDADGMALDAQGNVWVTGFSSGFFERIGPDGSRLPRVDTPAGSITQIRFGGADMQDCYFNSVPSSAGNTLKEGGQPTAQDSFLFRGRSELPGMRLDPPRFELGA